MKDARLGETPRSWLDKTAVGPADLDALGVEMQAVPEHLLEAAEHAYKMSVEEIDETIHRIVEEHGNDPNFPPAVVAAAHRYLYDEDAKLNLAEFQHMYEELKVEAALIVVNSPYAEVRAIVDNYDDPRVSGATFRTLVIGTIFVGTGAFINQFFSIRFPTITVYANFAQVLAFPAAKLMELLPTTQFTTFGYTWSLNPGKFNLKEHMLITIMANVGFNTPFTNNIIWVQYLPQYFNQSWATGFGYQIMIALSTNFMGYGLAGLTRRFLVYPAHAIWPSNLALISLIKAFHADKRTVAHGWRLSKAAPNNVHLAAITGSVSGLGFNPIPTFDWNQITPFVDPMIHPFFSTFNTFLGAMITFPIIVAMWYTNTWNTGYLPINANRVFDNTGNFYNVSNALGSTTLFDQALYENYSPAYLSAGYIIVYGAFFAGYTATLTHTILYHRHEITQGLNSIFTRKRTSEAHKDVHVRLMMAYKEVPEWHVLLIAIGVGAAGIGVYPTETSPAVVLYGVLVAIIFVIPVGIIMASTNVQITLNVISELLGGFWFPGNAVAMNYFKAYGYVVTAHALTFTQDLKLAHYMHIPPMQTFWAQIYATIVSSFICVGILNFQMSKISGVCTPNQVDHFICPGINLFFTSSVLWGTLGPKRMFGAGGMYNSLLYCFLIGAVLPIPFFFMRRKFKMFEFLHVPVLLTGGMVWAPYNLANIWPAVPIAYVFNVYIKKRYIAWWSKYNYITSAAFSIAIAISAVVIFFAVEWLDVEIVWSGNTRPFEGCDGVACPRLPIPDSGFFGPGPGEFH
ncbi:OPT-domain-containing protein [Mycena vulgaris]|nr:OPT-domain-containing protein [Mycena vulgaris]